MFSRIIEIHPCLGKESKKGMIEPKTFSKERPEKKKRLSQKLQEGSLSALKQILAGQRKELAQSMGAASPFSNQIQQMAAAEGQEIASIGPSAQVTQLFDKLVETMIQIKNDGIDETTFFLDGDAFSSSIFQGAKITITEYSTAPKIFNIQFSATGEALAFFEGHAQALIATLQSGIFGFGVHRLDTSLLTENEKHALPPVERDNEKEEKQK